MPGFKHQHSGLKWPHFVHLHSSPCFFMLTRTALRSPKTSLPSFFQLLHLLPPTFNFHNHVLNKSGRGFKFQLPFKIQDKQLYTILSAEQAKVGVVERKKDWKTSQPRKVRSQTSEKPNKRSANEVRRKLIRQSRGRLQ